jgi:5-methyltetrahydropteroyltriglutamate--homocysteine methyltransferase
VDYGLPLFPTQEIGSIAKPNWLVKRLRGVDLNDDDRAEFHYWLNFAGITERDELESLVSKKEPTPAGKTKLKEWSSLLVLKCFEKVGLDIVYDGEQQRSEMYQEPVSFIDGFKFYGEVRSFDNKYYKKAACVDKPKLKDFYHQREFTGLKTKTARPLKIPITGAYTIVNWSFNEFYLRKWREQEKNIKSAAWKANEEFALDLAQEIIRPNIEALVRAGALMIQVDEPAATTRPGEVGIFVQSFNESCRGIDCRFNLHICFSDYSLLYPALLDMENCCQYTFEFANKGANLVFLELMNKNHDSREVGLGVLDVHTDEIETPELVRDRILQASRIIPAERIFVNPDCGLRTRSWRVAFAKLENMVKGVELARQAITGS